jgi:hypothetical protein
LERRKVAFRIEYFRGDIIIMALPCPKNLHGAERIAQSSLRLFKADKAQILDMDDAGKVVATIEMF